MSNYTESLENRAFDIDWAEDEDYRQKMIETAKSFRNFDEALDEYIAEHGYKGKRNDLESKLSFLKEKFVTAGVPVPRNLRKWYTEHKAIQKDTAIQLCFALDLDIKEADTFLRRICLKRAFDCHDPKELIYYYAIVHKIEYQTALAAIEKLDTPSNKALNFDEEVLYTSSIIDEISEFDDLDDVVVYINNNITQFGYNNATACASIIELWRLIEGDSGIAEREEEVYLRFGEGSSMTKKRSMKKKSIVDIYLQILALGRNQVKGLKSDRSLKPVLKDNALLHPLAEHSFPDREGLTKILNGEHVSDERIRKMLIFLAFYKYWATLAIKRGKYSAVGSDTERCFSEINNLLFDAGYPSIYPGNPFDWLIIYASNDNEPLSAFRYFMGELFNIKADSKEITLQNPE